MQEMQEMQEAGNVAFSNLVRNKNARL